MLLPQRDSRPMPTDDAAPYLRPDLHTCALLLDVDGTLVDIAPKPDDVSVPPSLRRALARLVERTGGAVALVSGRSVADLDRMFAPLRLATVGGHGAEIRPVVGPKPSSRGAPALAAELRRRLLAIAGPGVLAEDKGYSVALHYRAAPEQEEFVRDAVADICAEPWPEPVEILPGKAVVEVKPAGFSKATGVQELMSRPPFAGRTPIFIGDDTTDESVFAIMPKFDGIAFSVGRPVAGAVQHFDTPADVRDWLDRLTLPGGPKSGPKTGTKIRTKIRTKSGTKT
jgi:trehalose 6-phosphate phosphatase